MYTETITSKEFAELYGCSQRYVNECLKNGTMLSYMRSFRKSGATWLIQVDKNWYDSKINSAE